MNDFARPIQKTIVLTVNGEEFILESNIELTADIKRDIELIARCFYEEDSTWYTDEILEMSSYDIADLFQNIVKSELGIELSFKAIDLEISIESDDY